MKRIFCFGDSLIQGFPYNSEYSWIKTVEKETGIQMLNYGVCGECCDEIFYRMNHNFRADNCTHVLFFGGMNDIIQGKPLKFILEDLTQVVAWSKAQDYKLCLVLPWFCSEKVLNKEIELVRTGILEQFGTSEFILDFENCFSEGLSERSICFLDGVHPSSETYTRLGEYAAPILKEWVEGEGNVK